MKKNSDARIIKLAKKQTSKNSFEISPLVGRNSNLQSRRQSSVNDSVSEVNFNKLFEFPGKGLEAMNTFSKLEGDEAPNSSNLKSLK